MQSQLAAAGIAITADHLSADSRLGHLSWQMEPPIQSPGITVQAADCCRFSVTKPLYRLTRPHPIISQYLASAHSRGLILCRKPWNTRNIRQPYVATDAQSPPGATGPEIPGGRLAAPITAIKLPRGKNIQLSPSELKPPQSCTIPFTDYPLLSARLGIVFQRSPGSSRPAYDVEGLRTRLIAQPSPNWQNAILAHAEHQSHKP